MNNYYEQGLTDFAVAVILLDGIVFGVADAAHPIDAFAGGKTSGLQKRPVYVKFFGLKLNGRDFTSEAKYLAMAASFINGLPASLSRAAL